MAPQAGSGEKAQKLRRLLWARWWITPSYFFWSLAAAARTCPSPSPVPFSTHISPRHDRNVWAYEELLRTEPGIGAYASSESSRPHVPRYDSDFQFSISPSPNACPPPPPVLPAVSDLHSRLQGLHSRSR